MKYIYSFILTGVLCVAANAQAAGTLDTSFDGDGKVISTFGATDTGAAAVRQPDGKLIVVGIADGAQPLLSFGVARLNTDGSMDTTFDGDGRALVGIGAYARAYAVALQPDGKIVVAGSTGSGFDENFAVARLNPNGSLDTSFNTTGYWTTSLGYGDRVYSVLIQSDGKIVLVGTAETPERSSDFAIVRLNADGTNDTSFDTDGIVYTQVGAGNGADFCYGGTLQADGKIVAVGSNTSGSNDFQTAVVRYNTDGSLDTSFDTDGRLNITLEQPVSRARAVAIQTDGKIVVGGTSANYTGTDSAFMVLRLNTDGSFDTSFDTDGKVRTPLGSYEAIINAIGIHPDGKIFAAGVSSSTGVGARDASFTRYNSDGSLDTGFDTDGILVRGMGAEEDSASSLIIEPEGKVTVAGFRAETTSRQYEYAVMQIAGDGSRDTSFSSDGMVAFWVGVDDFVSEEIYSIYPMADGRIMAAGMARSEFAIARYNANGTLDTTFDGDGRVSVSPLSNPNHQGSAYAYDVTVQPDGKTVVVGSIHNYTTSNTDIVIVRLMPDGSLDTGFDTDGKVVTAVGTSMDVARAVVIQPDGKIVVAGESAPTSSKINFFVGRYNTDGSLDTTFDGDGYAVTPIGPARDAAFDVILLPDGKIVAGGYSYSGNFGFPRAAVARYNADGTLDTTFDGDGMALNVGPSNIFSMALIPGGKIILGGTTGGDFAASRMNPDGTMDTSFGEFGMAVATVGTQSGGRSMAVQGDGKIVIAGSSRASNISELDFTLVRFTANGVLDTTFDGDGKLITPVSTLEDKANAVAIQRDGKIIAAGKSFSNTFRDDFAMARYFSGYTPRRTPFDFDGDGKTDIGIFRSSAAEWWISRSSDNGLFATQFGATTDAIVPADYTGDGKTDVAFWRPASGDWFVLRSEDFSYFSYPFGANGDVPVSGDYDADGKADTAVFRPTNATWYIRRSTDGQATITTFGADGDVPVPADYDGDGRVDLAIFRPSLGQWWINRSTAGVIATTFGDASVKPVPGDYTGDGKADVAFWRPSTGDWFVLRSDDFSYYSAPFGVMGDIPSPGDYDGDGKFDLTVFRPSNATWYANRSTGGTLIQQFGQTGDRPIPSAFVP